MTSSPLVARNTGPASAPDVVSVSEALKGRTSIRAFRPDPVPEAVVRDILEVARFSPSGSNMQPWRVIAVAGEERRRSIEAVRAALADNPGGEGAEYPTRPSPIWEPYRSRRFKNAEDMYALLGIPREDRPARLAYLTRNGEFFDAPVGLFFVIDRNLGHCQWAHLGMFMQSVALAAYERGLGTCMQEFWGQGRETLRRHFALPETDLVYCGMALGVPDPSAPVNALRSDRADVDEICDFKGFV
ncbi:MAG: nitroreductase [Phenylobacterium sp.]|uniref:nitroreductase n=1 Tax=Phenylobacterium sp. TaxID=1871053 RepID=UPI00273504ED|nr:nitroreductase [Phenylobacterium sp.]MDP3750013.1 nitroreductase [Phenylobacterium sp.]